MPARKHRPGKHGTDPETLRRTEEYKLQKQLFFTWLHREELSERQDYYIVPSHVMEGARAASNEGYAALHQRQDINGNPYHIVRRLKKS